MPQPTPYTQQHDYSSELGTEHGQHLDDEFVAIRTTLSQILANLSLIQRDDGLLRNAAVHLDSLSSAVYALLAGVDGAPKGSWLTGTTYIVGDSVTESNSTYLCATNHVAATFATDYAAGKWLLVQSPAGNVTAAAVTVTPTGGVASTSVQNAIAELDTEKASATGSASNQFAVAAATAAASAVSFSQAQSNTMRFVVAGGTVDALTATLSPAATTTLSDGFQLFVRASGANATTTPTLNLTLGATPTGNVTLVRGTTGGALAAGSIAGSSHILHLIYNLSQNKWQLLNPAA